MNIETTPWILAAITAVWFGVLARRAKRNWGLWAVGGALFALITSTIIFGLGNAASTPFSDHDHAMLRVKWTAISAVVIAVLGWLITLGLHRNAIESDSAAPGAPTGQSRAPKP